MTRQAFLQEDAIKTLIAWLTELQVLQDNARKEQTNLMYELDTKPNSNRAIKLQRRLDELDELLYYWSTKANEIEKFIDIIEFQLWSPFWAIKSPTLQGADSE